MTIVELEVVKGFNSAYPWAIRDKTTGQWVAGPPEVFDRPHLGKTVISGSIGHKTKREALVALAHLEARKASA